MNKLPTKQIYILIIVIVGIIAVSVYSTYAIFTLESETDNIVSIKTPHNVELTTESYEYKQIVVPKNSYINVDIDLYNNTDDNLCYGVWYKIITNNSVNENKIKIYENTNTSLTTSGVIDSITSKRINLLIINDNDTNAKINIGTTTEKNSDSCSLNLTTDRKLISGTIDNPKVLSENLTQNISTINNKEGYLTYQNNKEEITITLDKIFISSSFTYKEELFTLTNPEAVNTTDLNNYLNNENNSYYTCLGTDKCINLIKINSIKTTEEQISIDKYDTLIGYLAGESGLRKVNDNYLYYGDNPNNFIYYNCKNELDHSTCELWRMIGFYQSKEGEYITKLIKDDSIGTYAYNKDNNLFNNSEIYNYLNKEYKISNNSLLTEITYQEENVVSIENNENIISYLEDKHKAYVTLMNLTDYLNASVCQNKNITDYDSTCLNNNWLNKNNTLNEYTMTIKYEMPTTDPETEEEITPDNNIVYSVGNNITETIITEKLSVRPVVYLKERALLISGDGTINNPYIIK